MEGHGELDADARFAANLRLWRERRELSQAALAQEMTARGHGWHQSTVARAEQGKQAVRVSEAEALGEILKVSIGRLLRGPEESAQGLEADLAADAIRLAWEEAVNAAARLRSARPAAAVLIAALRGSAEPGVREAAGELAVLLGLTGPEIAATAKEGQDD